MKVIVSRYSFTKEFISSGTLTVTSEGQLTKLNFSDSIIEINVSELYYPLLALENLRKILETDYGSFINCVGCKIDSAYKLNGGYVTYQVVYRQQATVMLNIFDTTNEIEKLCTVPEHKIAYSKWLDSLASAP